MPKPITFLSITALAFASLTLTGCGPDLTHSFGDEHTEEGAVSAVQVSGGSGTVVVERSESASSVSVARTVHYQGDEPSGRYDELDGTVLRLASDCGDDCWIDYTVTVPEEVEVAGRIGSGDFRLSGISRADVSTGSGDIEITDVTESVAAEAGSGNVTVSDAAGPVTARAGSGNIQLDAVEGAVTTSAGSGDTTIWLSTAEDVLAKTSSGDVDVTVPTGAAYRVDAESSSGDTDVSIASDADSDHHLDLATGSGDITVSDG